MRNYFKVFGEEFAKHGLGWTIGLLTANFVSEFFVVRSWKNVWGLTTGKAAVSETAMTFIEFLTEGVFGFAAFILVNRMVKNYWKSKGAKMD